MAPVIKLNEKKLIVNTIRVLDAFICVFDIVDEPFICVFLAFDLFNCFCFVFFCLCILTYIYNIVCFGFDYFL